MRWIILIAVLLCHATMSRAEDEQSCFAGKDYPLYAAYCKELNETGCRMNYPYCRWPKTFNSCEPIDPSDTVGAAFCKGMVLELCEANSHRCYWFE